MSKRQEVLDIAHRGCRSLAPENTLASARAGLATGAPWWELDVAASSDGELVVLHDDSLVRTTDAEERFPGRAPWCVYDFSLAELRSLGAGSWFEAADPFGQIAAGRVSRASLASYRGERMPTLREALGFTKANRWKVNVEIKDATGRACDPWIVERTAAMIVELGLLGSVCISSFNHDYLRRTRKAEPRLPIGALDDLEERGKEPPEATVARLRELGAEAWHPGLALLEEPSVRAVREAGLGVKVWTVNEEADMERLIAWGASGLFTDFPDRLAALLARA
jgi:glycerophosphoryl diester phosphodiesterase